MSSINTDFIRILNIPNAGVVVPKAGAVEPVPKVNDVLAPKAGAVDVAPKAGVAVAPKVGALEVAPKVEPKEGVPVPKAGAEVAGVPNNPVDAWVVAVPRPNPGVAAGLE